MSHEALDAVYRACTSDARARETLRHPRVTPATCGRLEQGGLVMWAQALGFLLALVVVATAGAKSVGAEEPDCPPGTVVKGKAPPDGRKQWCEDAAGVQQGPTIAWDAEGNVRVRARFSNGVMDGPIASFHADGAIAEEGAFNLGFVTMPLVLQHLQFGNLFGFLWFWPIQ